ncbi:unnamed protein product [Pleuronectes platessa]|uniref:Uncharacterized protein n=1 Tax=Pleuronectes platessa TaxID=8262 RepID=A0A9N7V5K9_PLEPL|nr:unnamed protein product [Pleuronectes platessa]
MRLKFKEADKAGKVRGRVVEKRGQEEGTKLIGILTALLPGAKPHSALIVRRSVVYQYGKALKSPTITDAMPQVSHWLPKQTNHGCVHASSRLSQSHGDVPKGGSRDVNLANMATLREEYGDWKYERF